MLYSHHNQEIHVKGVVCGKGITPYCVPKKIIVECGKNKDFCSKCSIHINNVMLVRCDNGDVLKFVDTQSSRFISVIKQLLGVGCDFSYEIAEIQYITRIFILPPIEKGKEECEELAYISYIIGETPMDVNVTYDLKGFTVTEPKTQIVTHIFSEVTRLESNIDNFIIENEYEKLKQFNVINPTTESIFEHLKELYSYYASITNIYSRFDLHMAVDLTTKSVLSFYFDGEYVHKGWFDIIIIGDSRCGKGFVAEKLCNYFGVGEVVSGENCSFAGLVAGLHSVQGQWTVSWGKIPLNDRGLVIIDEAGEIGNWSRLSRVRSEGVAEIAKIQSQSTYARTRLISIMNPRNSTMSSYSYGILALSDVIKTPEDIARFDFCITVAHNEVSVTEINKNASIHNLTQMFNSELVKCVVMWGWCGLGGTACC